jgi:hypothetical protein
MSNDDNHQDPYRELLVEDIKSIYGFQHHLSSLRGLILGASLTVLGAIITYSRTNTDSLVPTTTGHPSGFKIATVHLLLLGIAYSTVRIVGAMNRAQLLFGTYIDAVQKKIGGAGFWHCLGKYIHDKGDKDTITHGFAIGVQQVSYAMSFYVLISCVYYLCTLSESVIENGVRISQLPALILGILLVLGSFFAAIKLTVWVYHYVPESVDTLSSAIASGNSKKVDNSRQAKSILAAMADVVRTEILPTILPAVSTHDADPRSAKAIRDAMADVVKNEIQINKDVGTNVTSRQEPECPGFASTPALPERMQEVPQPLSGGPLSRTEALGGSNLDCDG